MSLSKVRDNDTTQGIPDMNLTTSSKKLKHGHLSGSDTMKQKLKSNWKMVFNKDASRDFKIKTEAVNFLVLT